MCSTGETSWVFAGCVCVVYLGYSLCKKQEELITGHTEMVALMLDQDDAGRKATQEIVSRLARRVFVKVVELRSPGDQPDRLKEEDLARLLKGI